VNGSEIGGCLRNDFCVVIVNWNGWRHTIECLESLLRVETERLHVIVADNHSTDSSLAYISEWAAGTRAAPTDGPPWRLLPEQRYLQPVLVEQGNLSPGDHQVERALYLHLLALKRNGGFAAGCNAGMRVAFEKLNCRYVWLLNNDAVADPTALHAFRQCFAEHPRQGLCGGVLCEYERPGHVQAFGGGFDFSTTVSHHLAGGRPLDALPPLTELRQQFYYPIGANMAVSGDFVRGVGWMNEEYFLYYEELDWVERGRSKYAIGLCDQAIVYHKEGAAIGTTAVRRKSALSTYYLVYNKLRFLQTYYPHCKGKAYRRFFKEMRKHLQQGDFCSTVTMIRAIWDFHRQGERVDSAF